MNNKYSAYKKTQINTADQGSLLLMLFDGAIKFMKLAKEAIDLKKIDMAHNNLVKAQNIVCELMVSLNLDVGEVAKNLFSLYSYMHKRLIEANIKKDLKIVDEVLTMFTDLRETWGQVVGQVRKDKAGNIENMAKAQKVSSVPPPVAINSAQNQNTGSNTAVIGKIEPKQIAVSAPPPGINKSSLNNNVPIMPKPVQSGPFKK